MSIRKLIEIFVRGKDESKPALDAARKSVEDLGKAQDGLTSKYGASVNTSKLFDEATSRINSRLADFGVELGSGTLKLAAYAAGTAAIGVVAAKAGEALYRFADAQASVGDEFNDLNLRTGIAVETLSGLDYALKLNGGSTQDLETGVRTLSSRMNDLRTGSSEAANDFARLGLSLADVANGDGSLKTIEQILPLVADGFAGLSSQTERMDLAQALFGRGGLKLLPTLQQGSSGLAEMRAELERLGGTMGTDFARAGDQFKDAQVRVATATQRVNEVISAPLMKTFAGAMDIAALAAGKLANALKGIGGGDESVTVDVSQSGLADVNSQIAALEARMADLRSGRQAGPHTENTMWWRDLEKQLAALQSKRYEIEVSLSDADMSKFERPVPDAGPLAVEQQAVADLAAAYERAQESAWKLNDAASKLKDYGAADSDTASPRDYSVDTSGRVVQGGGGMFETRADYSLMNEGLVEGIEMMNERMDLEAGLNELLAERGLAYGDILASQEAEIESAAEAVQRYEYAAGVLQSSMTSAFNVMNLRGKKVAQEIAGAFINAAAQIAAAFAAKAFLNWAAPGLGSLFGIGSAGGGTTSGAGGVSALGANSMLDSGAYIQRASARYSRGYI